MWQRGQILVVVFPGKDYGIFNDIILVIIQQQYPEYIQDHRNCTHLLTLELSREYTLGL